MDESPNDKRNNAENIPSKSNGPKLFPSFSPNAKAMENTKRAWNNPRNTLDNILDKMIDSLRIGATKSLFKKPNLRSQTTDIPLNIAVNRTIVESMPAAM